MNDRKMVLGWRKRKRYCKGGSEQDISGFMEASIWDGLCFWPTPHACCASKSRNEFSQKNG